MTVYIFRIVVTSTFYEISVYECMQLFFFVFTPHPSRFSTAQWKDLFVGDVVRIHKDQVIPVRLQFAKTMKMQKQTNDNIEICLYIDQLSSTSGKILCLLFIDHRA